MNKFKQFREARQHTQEKIAEVLKTTQQIIASWESGKAEPSLVELRDLALIYSTSVNDLLGKNPFTDGAVTNSYFSLDGSDERFWGHIGILIPGNKNSCWYPITMQESNRIANFMLQLEVENPQILVSTLNNRMLLLNANAVQRVYLLNDDADQIDTDWELTWDAYQGHSPEIYRALVERLEGVDDSDEWSDSFMAALDELIKEESLTDELILERIVQTKVYLNDASIQHLTPSDENLLAIIHNIEMDSITVFDLSNPDRGLDIYLPTTAVRMIDMPLYKVVEACQLENDLYKAEYEAEATTNKIKVAQKTSRRKPST